MMNLNFSHTVDNRNSKILLLTYIYSFFVSTKPPQTVPTKKGLSGKQFQLNFDKTLGWLERDQRAFVQRYVFPKQKHQSSYRWIIYSVAKSTRCVIHFCKRVQEQLIQTVSVAKMNGDHFKYSYCVPSLMILSLAVNALLTSCNMVCLEQHIFLVTHMSSRVRSRDGCFIFRMLMIQ